MDDLEITPEIKAQLLEILEDSQLTYQQRWNKAHPGYTAKHSAKWRRDNPDKDRASQAKYRIKKFYKLSSEEYRELVATANGHCMLCGVKQDDILNIDHNHETGKVRGLVCRGCNVGLGGFKDDPKLLIKAIQYLVSH